MLPFLFSLCLVRLFLFFCLAAIGGRGSGSPGITHMSLGAGFGLWI